MLSTHQPRPTKHELAILKLSDVAARLGLSAMTIRRRVKDGSLPHIRMKGRLYFRPHEVQAFLEAHRGRMQQWLQVDVSEEV